MYHLTCDRCGEPIDVMAPEESATSQDRISLVDGEGVPEGFDLHKGCAREFRGEFRAWVKRSKMNPPTP